MNKTDLIAEVAKNTDLTKVDPNVPLKRLSVRLRELWRKATKFAWSALARSAWRNVRIRPVAIRARVPRSKFRHRNSRSSKRVKVWKTLWTKTGSRTDKGVSVRTRLFYAWTFFPFFRIFPEERLCKNPQKCWIFGTIFPIFPIFRCLKRGVLSLNLYVMQI